MKKVVLPIVLCLALCLSMFSGCAKDPNKEYLDLINSKDYRKKIEMLPDLIDFEKAEEIYYSTKNKFRNPEYLHGFSLNRYLLALLEEDEIETFSEIIPEMLVAFRYPYNVLNFISDMADFYPDKLEIVYPYVLELYEKEEDMVLKRWWTSCLSTIYSELGDSENCERMREEEKENSRQRQENGDIANAYAKLIMDGDITIDDVPTELRTLVKISLQAEN